MNERIKKLWLEALRSGEYTQATCQLRRDHADNDGSSYCCLGVLCDLHAKEQKTGYWVGESYRIPDPSDPDNTTKGVYLRETPDATVADWAELGTPADYYIQADREQDTREMMKNAAKGSWQERTFDAIFEALGTYNDTGFDFDEIANVIEEKL